MLTTQTATAGATDYHTPSVITDHDDEDIITPSLSSRKEDSTVPDALNLDEHRYFAKPISQDRPFTPAGLPKLTGLSRDAAEEGGESSADGAIHRAGRRSTRPILPAGPNSPPQIYPANRKLAATYVLSRSVPVGPSHSRPRASRVPLKLVRATLTPGAWRRTHISSKYGSRVRVCCSPCSEIGSAVDIVVVYLYNSALFRKPYDQDADLDIFYHTKDVKSPSSQGVQKAKTIRREQSKDPLPETFAEHSERVNWLEEFEMLRRFIPGSRIITIGFDIAPLLLGISSFDKISVQLLEHLGNTRGEAEHIPLVFLGHVYGGILILRMLSFLSEKYTSPVLNSNIAGLFLFSCPVAHSHAHSQDLSDFYGAKTSGIFFGGHYNTHIMQQLQDSAASGLYSQHPPKEKHDVRGAKDMAKDELKMKPIRIGFPIFQFAFEGESRDDKGYTVVRASSELFSGAVETIYTMNHMANALRFSSSRHIIIQKILLSMQYSLKTHRILHAVVAGNVEETQAIVKADPRANLRDRWDQTALHIAVLRNDQNMVISLLEVDVDPNVRDESLNTPLHYAVLSGNETIIRKLLQHGADIGLENNRRQTPRDIAEKHESRKHMVSWLKSRLLSGPDQSFSNPIGSGDLPTSWEGQLACGSFQLTITEIFASGSTDKHWSTNVSVGALLYGPASLDETLRHFRPPDVEGKTPVCVWIHVPENNMIWLEDLFKKLGLHETIWQDTRRSNSESLQNRVITPHVSRGDICSIFLPYLSYEWKTRQMKRTKYVQAISETIPQDLAAQLALSEEYRAFERVVISPEDLNTQTQLLRVTDGEETKDFLDGDDVTDTKSPKSQENVDPDDLEKDEKALIKCYLHNPPALHVRRTLDQYFYHMLENTLNRDDDQVVSRWASKDSLWSEPGVSGGNLDGSKDRHNILMVDQLWLWTLSQRDGAPSIERNGHKVDISDRKESVEKRKVNFVVSCFPSRTGADRAHRTMDDLQRLVLDPHRRKRAPIRKPEQLVSRILETCFGVFDRLQEIPMLRFFQMFEDSIGSIDDEESRQFAEFKRGSTELLELNATNKFYNERKNSLMADLLDIRKEIDLLVEVKDIRDEINIIRSVLNVQKDLISQMPDLHNIYAMAKMIQADIDDFINLDERAKTIQDKLNTLMDLKQKTANAWEAREARETAVATRKQGSTLMVFTMVTIIFLPLSFMASFFAIGIAAFPKDRTSGQVSWPLRTVMGILFGVSLAVSTPLIVFALNMDYCASFHRELRNNYLRLIGIKLIARLVPLAPLGSPNLLIQWSERLQNIREEYMRDIKYEQNGSLSNVKVDNGTTTEDTEPGEAIPSTASSHVSKGVDTEMLCSRRSRWRRPKFGLWRRKMDNDLPSDKG
jgi:Mg2+ and Co2+ transporter CorA